MERLGIERDDQWTPYFVRGSSICGLKAEEESSYWNYKLGSVAWMIGDPPRVNAYRLDKLLLALPEWWADNADALAQDRLSRSQVLNELGIKLQRLASSLTYYIQTAQIAEALHACCELLVLLDENKLLGETNV